MSDYFSNVSYGLGGYWNVSIGDSDGNISYPLGHEMRNNAILDTCISYFAGGEYVPCAAYLFGLLRDGESRQMKVGNGIVPVNYKQWALQSPLKATSWVRPNMTGAKTEFDLDNGSAYYEQLFEFPPESSSQIYTEAGLRSPFVANFISDVVTDLGTLSSQNSESRSEMLLSRFLFTVETPVTGIKNYFSGYNGNIYEICDQDYYQPTPESSGMVSRPGRQYTGYLDGSFGGVATGYIGMEGAKYMDSGFTFYDSTFYGSWTSGFIFSGSAFSGSIYSGFLSFSVWAPEICSGFIFSGSTPQGSISSGFIRLDLFSGDFIRPMPEEINRNSIFNPFFIGYIEDEPISGYFLDSQSINDVVYFPKMHSRTGFHGGWSSQYTELPLNSNKLFMHGYRRKGFEYGFEYSGYFNNGSGLYSHNTDVVYANLIDNDGFDALSKQEISGNIISVTGLIGSRNILTPIEVKVGEYLRINYGIRVSVPMTVSEVPVTGTGISYGSFNGSGLMKCFGRWSGTVGGGNCLFGSIDENGNTIEVGRSTYYYGDTWDRKYNGIVPYPNHAGVYMSAGLVPTGVNFPNINSITGIRILNLTGSQYSEPPALISDNYSVRSAISTSWPIFDYGQIQQNSIHRTNCKKTIQNYCDTSVILDARYPAYDVTFGGFLIGWSLKYTAPYYTPDWYAPYSGMGMYWKFDQPQTKYQEQVITLTFRSSANRLDEKLYYL
jgi:hypothetical protein